MMMHAVNVSTRSDKIVELAEKVQGWGAREIMIDVITCGYGCLQALAEDPSIKVMPEGSIKDAVAALSDGTVDAIIFDHSENNDISDMIGGLNRLGRTVPIVMVSKDASKDVKLGDMRVGTVGAYVF